MEFRKRCPICEKEFISDHPRTTYCGETCRKKGGNIRSRKATKSSKEVAEMHKPMIDIAVAAREAGMSYGQYVAMMGL